MQDTNIAKKFLCKLDENMCDCVIRLEFIVWFK